AGRLRARLVVGVDVLLAGQRWNVLLLHADLALRDVRRRALDRRRLRALLDVWLAGRRLNALLQLLLPLLLYLLLYLLLPLLLYLLLLDLLLLDLLLLHRCRGGPPGGALAGGWGAALGCTPFGSGLPVAGSIAGAWARMITLSDARRASALAATGSRLPASRTHPIGRIMCMPANSPDTVALQYRCSLGDGCDTRALGPEFVAEIVPR